MAFTAGVSPTAPPPSKGAGKALFVETGDGGAIMAEAEAVVIRRVDTNISQTAAVHRVLLMRFLPVELIAALLNYHWRVKSTNGDLAPKALSEGLVRMVSGKPGAVGSDG